MLDGFRRGESGASSIGAKRLGTVMLGCPVRFVIESVLPPNDGETKTSTSSNTFLNFLINIVLARLALMYSTAGMKRLFLNELGQAPGS